MSKVEEGMALNGAPDVVRLNFKTLAFQLHFTVRVYCAITICIYSDPSTYRRYALVVTVYIIIYTTMEKKD